MHYRNWKNIESICIKKKRLEMLNFDKVIIFVEKIIVFPCWHENRGCINEKHHFPSWAQVGDEKRLSSLDTSGSNCCGWFPFNTLLLIKLLDTWMIIKNNLKYHARLLSHLSLCRTFREWLPHRIIIWSRIKDPLWFLCSRISISMGIYRHVRAHPRFMGNPIFMQIGRTELARRWEDPAP